jgi:hypothetical protein
MIHGKNQVTIETLRTIPVLPRPEGVGHVWRGVQHGELVDTLTCEAAGRGWNVGSDITAYLSPDQAGCFGCINLEIPHLEIPGQTLGLGWKHDNFQRKPIELYVGTTVWVCSNGMVTGEIIMNRRHTNKLDLRGEIETALDEYFEKAHHIPMMITAMRNRELTGAEAEHALIEAGRRGLMPWSRLGDVDREYRVPRFAEIGTGTSWALFNAFTYTVQRNPAHAQLDQIAGFRELLPVAAA